MASSRRLGAPDAKNRSVLLDAAEQLLLEEGYAAVSSRRVAAKAGLKPQLVHYYFRNMDELFLAVFRRRAEEGLKHQAAALASPQPLWALWEFSTETEASSLTMEFVGLANQRKAIRAEIAYYSERFRRGQIEAVSGLVRRYKIDPNELSPGALVVLMTGISRMIMMEKALGMSSGHAETFALVERHLERLEGPREPRRPQPD
ncbi:TetR/AcrR family transcriptional regulator [Actinomadura craniellae]|uniref:TetR/AcrR family transcriptional regulator n=1 Tax=Actinomadura craniellae TaxID=2231787 RepID=A0A365HFU6_9ACTN|nr:TetR/AcrR family transcriptional regulator [Actinomadura craniellae]RAY16973.1 TetR/AcrR family transcriptional regulator [Actinomadura craniellae]